MPFLLGTKWKEGLVLRAGDPRGTCRYRALFFRVYREVSPKTSQSRVSKAFLSDCWILQIPLSVGSAPRPVTVSGMWLKGEEGNTQQRPLPAPRQDCNCTPNRNVREEKKKSSPSSGKVSGRKWARKVRNSTFSSAGVMGHIQMSDVGGKSPPFPQGFFWSSLMVTVFTSVYSASAYSPNSLPFPDILKPPNGACA